MNSSGLKQRWMLMWYVSIHLVSCVNMSSTIGIFCVRLLQLFVQRIRAMRRPQGVGRATGTTLTHFLSVHLDRQKQWHFQESRKAFRKHRNIKSRSGCCPEETESAAAGHLFFMKQALKLFSLFLITLSLTLVSCKDDKDEPANEIDDWYSECISVSGGGLSSQQCSQLQNTINTDEDLEMGPQYVWRNIDRSQAVYYFDRQTKSFCQAFSSGMSGISGTLTVTFALKNSKGTTVKTSRVKITSSSSSMDWLPHFQHL